MQFWLSFIYIYIWEIWFWFLDQLLLSVCVCQNEWTPLYYATSLLRTHNQIQFTLNFFTIKKQEIGFKFMPYKLYLNYLNKACKEKWIREADLYMSWFKWLHPCCQLLEPVLNYLLLKFYSIRQHQVKMNKIITCLRCQDTLYIIENMKRYRIFLSKLTQVLH